MSHFLPPEPHARPIQEPVSVSRGPTPEDWESHRLLIKQLYMDDRKPLREVMGILEKRGLKASPKMFKGRISKWGYDKKNKEKDMVAILRKKHQRDAIGKATSFRVRGQVVPFEHVLQYFKRKGGTTNATVSAVSTPSDVSYRTPSPFENPRSGHNTPQMISADREMLLDGFEGNQLDTQMGEANVSDYGRRESTTGFPLIDEDITEPIINCISNFLSAQTFVPRSPSPPQNLLLPERLFWNITTYYSESINTTWSFNKTGLPCNLHSNSVHAEGEFLHNCALAIHLWRLSSFVNFHRAVSTACKLIKTLLQADNPVTLLNILSVILSFSKEGLTNVVSLLRTYIASMSEEIIAGQHPRGHIYQILGAIAEETLRESVIQSWSCIVDVLEQKLGLFNGFRLESRHYLHRLMRGTTNLLEEERFYIQLLTKLQVQPITSPEGDHAGLRIKTFLMSNLSLQGRNVEAVKLGREILNQAEGFVLEVDKVQYQVSACRKIAQSYYCQHNQALAEKGMRNAIRILVRYYGQRNFWTIRIMMELKAWFREWGRISEADQLGVEIGKLMEFNDVDDIGLGEGC